LDYNFFQINRLFAAAMKKNETTLRTIFSRKTEHKLATLLRLGQGIKSLRSIRGFTLVELMLVIAIIGIIVSIAIPSYTAHFDKKDSILAAGDIVMIAECLNRYSVLYRKYPDTLAAGACGEKMEDAWGNAYEYYNHEEAKGNGKFRKDGKLNPINTYFDLYSLGKDGKSKENLKNKDSKDDIIYARDGKFIGLAENF
jgi:general secretion pathway protein G